MSKKNLIITSFVLLFVFAFSIPIHAGEAKPVQLSLFNPVQLVAEGEAVRGVRLSFLYGKNTTVTGFDFGLVQHNTSGLSKGYQLGAIGLIEGDFIGFQKHFYNSVKGNCEGFQLGFVNHANNMNGFQLGFVNHAETMNGLQIGFINIIKQNGQFPIFPFINWSF